MEEIILKRSIMLSYQRNQLLTFSALIGLILFLVIKNELSNQLSMYLIPGYSLLILVVYIGLRIIKKKVRLNSNGILIGADRIEWNKINSIQYKVKSRKTKYGTRHFNMIAFRGEQYSLEFDMRDINKRLPDIIGFINKNQPSIQIDPQILEHIKTS